MYVQHFGLEHAPFSIAPDPRFLFLSAHHREALAHLLYGLEAGGGFVVLTGDIGAGKTTVCRCFLEQVPPTCQVAYVFNPRLTVVELLAEVCQEFGVEPPPAAPGAPVAGTVKAWLDPLNRFLLASHAAGRSSVLVIDEAQQLSSEVLEQLRLLTNLETHERKLLQIILIGQPELAEMLARPGLEQLAQRVIARYHLGPLDEADTGAYLQHRLQVAGLRGPSPIGPGLWRRIHRHSAGLPRRINLLCDRALLGAYSQGLAAVDRRTLRQAMREVPASPTGRRMPLRWAAATATAVAAGLLLWAALDPGLGRTGDWLQQGLAALAGQRQAAGLNTAARPGTPPVPPAAASGTAAPPLAPSPPGPQDARTASAAVTLAGLESLADVSALAVLFSPRVDEDEARRRLATHWGETLPAGPPCPLAQPADLMCFETVGSLALLRQLDRPALLRLYAGEDGSPRWIALRALGEQAAVLGVDDRSYQVPLPVLAQAWRGEIATWWRRPAGHPGKLPPELPRVLAEWLERHLPQAPAGSPDTLASRLSAFQLSQNLKPDGKPGPLTIMALNRRIGVDEPVLPGTQP